jgi:hypothetical protein
MGPWPLDQFFHVGLWSFEHLRPHVLWGRFRDLEEAHVPVMPVYDGEGEDPQPRTNWDYDNCVLLTLNGRGWASLWTWGITGIAISDSTTPPT